jgi:hypothetical protein
MGGMMTLEAADRILAEAIAKFRTPPGVDWRPLADDIATLIALVRRQPNGPITMLGVIPAPEGSA